MTEPVHMVSYLFTSGKGLVDPEEQIWSLTFSSDYSRHRGAIIVCSVRASAAITLS